MPKTADLPKTFIRLTEDEGLMVDVWKTESGTYNRSLRMFYRTREGWFPDKRRGFSVRAENFAKIVGAFRSDKIDPILGFGKTEPDKPKTQTAKKPLKGQDLDDIPF